MSGSQFHNASDVCTAMSQFTAQTSQSSARGSFSTLDHLTTFSEAITCLCQEVTQLRAELDELKTKQAKRVQSAAARTTRRDGTHTADKAAAKRQNGRKAR